MSWPRAHVAVPVALGLFALALRLYGLADKPLWYDEVLTLKRVSLPLAELIFDSLKNRHYPSYFLLVGSIAPPGASAWLLRLPSALFGAASVTLVALIAQQLRGAWAGLAAGLLMSLSPFEVQFGQEARSYTFVSCLVLLALWGQVRIAQAPASAALAPTRPGGQSAAWAAYVLGTGGALEVLSIAIPWLIASNLAMIAVSRYAGPHKERLLRNWALAQVGILLIWLPGLIAVYLASRGTILHGLGWVPTLTLSNLWSIVSAVYLFRITDLITFQLLPTMVPGFGIAVASLALAGAWQLRRDRPLLPVVGLAMATMPVTLIAVSLFHPLLLPRYLMWSTGPYYILAGIAAVSLTRPLAALACAALVVGGGLSLAPYYEYETKPRWDLTATYLAANVQPGDAVVANTGAAHFMLSTFYAQLRLNPAVVAAAPSLSDAVARLATGNHVWILYGRVGQGQIEPEKQFLQKWRVLGASAQHIAFGRHVFAERFDPAKPPAVRLHRDDTLRN